MGNIAKLPGATSGELKPHNDRQNLWSLQLMLQARVATESRPGSNVTGIAPGRSPPVGRWEWLICPRLLYSRTQNENL